MSEYLPDMPLDQLVPSSSGYFTKDEFNQLGQDLQIDGFKREKVGQGDKAEMLTVMYFVGQSKGMVLKPTNMQLLKLAHPDCNSSGQFVGRMVNVYLDPTVSMAGQIVGGIRIRATQAQAAAAMAGTPPPAPAPHPDVMPAGQRGMAQQPTGPAPTGPSDDIPF